MAKMANPLFLGCSTPKHVGELVYTYYPCLWLRPPADEMSTFPPCLDEGTYIAHRANNVVWLVPCPLHPRLCTLSHGNGFPRLIALGHRAYVAMAVLHNFLDERVKSHEYLKLANSIVDDLPPEVIPRVRWYFEVYLTYTPTSTIGRQGPVVCTHRDSCEGPKEALPSTMVGTQAEGVLALKPKRAQFSTPACLSSRHLPAIDSASLLNSALPNFPRHVPNMLGHLHTRVFMGC